MLGIIRSCRVSGRLPDGRVVFEMTTWQQSGLSGVMGACGRVFAGLRSLLCGRFFSTIHKKDKITVAIEGNIGSGKTSLLQHFMNDKDVDVFMEPVNKWRNVDGHNALALMYEDASRWALTFQTYVQLTMLQTHTAPHRRPVKLMERSIFSAKYCFVENLYQGGKMPEIEYVILTKWFEYLLANEKVHLDLIVYLRTCPETVHERIRKRCRKEEEAIPIDYLRQLHELHEDWLIRKTKFSLPCPILVLDADSDLTEMQQVFDSRKKEILSGYG